MLLLVLLIAGFCEWQTKGFRFEELPSHLPNSPQWEVAPLAPAEEQALKNRLAQPFFYLGSGHQAVAFLGADGNTVLKLFRRTEPWKEFCMRLPLFAKCIQILSHFETFRCVDATLYFPSYKLAFEKLRQETALVCLHLNKTENLWGKAVLYDPLRIRHVIDLDKTEFVVQNYAEPFPVYANRLLREGQLEKARAALPTITEALRAYSRKGVRISSAAIHRNVGFHQDSIIFLDLGSFYEDTSSKEETQREEEVTQITRRLRRWTSRHYPPLLSPPTHDRSS